MQLTLKSSLSFFLEAMAFNGIAVNVGTTVALLYLHDYGRRRALVVEAENSAPKTLQLLLKGNII